MVSGSVPVGPVEHPPRPGLPIPTTDAEGMAVGTGAPGTPTKGATLLLEYWTLIYAFAINGAGLCFCMFCYNFI